MDIVSAKKKKLTYPRVANTIIYYGAINFKVQIIKNKI